MSNIAVAIVAVPSNADDLPGPDPKHCTLQYLGKIGDTGAPTLGDSLPALLSAVSAAAASVQPFTLPVERVGSLGDENATVWFLEDADMRMAELRAQALSPAVTALMEAGSFTKHPDFTPHVTVGYGTDVTAEVKAVTEIPFYAVSLWWGDERIEFPLGSLASPFKASALTALAIVDVHGNWHHPHTGKFIRKPWEFDQTLKALFPEAVCTKIDELTGSDKGTGWEDIYRLRKNLRVLAKEPENEALIDAAWAKVADLRARFSLASVKNMSGKRAGEGEPLPGLPGMDAVDATMDLVEEGLEFLETAWMYENYGVDENPDQEMLPLEPISFEPAPNEMPTSYGLGDEQSALQGRALFSSLFDDVHRVRRAVDIFVTPARSTWAKQANAVDGSKLSSAVNALTSLGDTQGARHLKNLAKKGDKAGLNGAIDGKVATLEKTAKSLESFISTEPSDYENPYKVDAKRSAAAKKGAAGKSDAEKSASAQKAADTRAANEASGKTKEQKRAAAGSPDGTGGEFIDDPDVAAKNAGGVTSANGIKKALEAGDIPKAQKAAEQYLTKVNTALDQLYNITFAGMSVVLASGAIQEVRMKETLLAKWEGPLGFEGQFTGDNRMIAPGALTWADDSFPQPMRWAAEDIGAHDGARVIGTIEGMSRLDEPMEWSGKTLPAGTIFGWGTFDIGSELGVEAQRQVVKKLSNGVSLDLDKVSAEMLDAAAAETELGLALDDAIEDRAITLIRGARNRAATLVALPAFEGARIQAVVTWSHEGGQTLKADRFKSTMTALASAGTAAFAGIRVDRGGRWGITVPVKGYRWVDMPDVALFNFVELATAYGDSKGAATARGLEKLTKEALQTKNPEQIGNAQDKVLDFVEDADFDFADKPEDEAAAEAIKDSLKGFANLNTDEIINALEDKAEGDIDSEKHEVGEPVEDASETASGDAPAGGAQKGVFKGKLVSPDGNGGGERQGYIDDVDAANAYLQEQDMKEFLEGSLKDAVTKLEWSIPKDDPSSWQVEVETNRPLTPDETKALFDFVEGQNSDGLGEGFEQQPFAQNDEDSGIFVDGQGPFDDEIQANSAAEDIAKSAGIDVDNEEEYEGWLDDVWEEIDSAMTSMRGTPDFGDLAGRSDTETDANGDEVLPGETRKLLGPENGSASADTSIDEPEPASAPATPADPKPADQIGTKSGRGPSGKVRNFDAMNDDKFVEEAAKVMREGNDPEAMEAVKKSSAMREAAGAEEKDLEDTNLLEAVHAAYESAYRGPDGPSKGWDASKVAVKDASKAYLQSIELPEGWELQEGGSGSQASTWITGPNPGVRVHFDARPDDDGGFRLSAPGISEGPFKSFDDVMTALGKYEMKGTPPNYHYAKTPTKRKAWEDMDSDERLAFLDEIGMGVNAEGNRTLGDPNSTPMSEAVKGGTLPQGVRELTAQEIEEESDGQTLEDMDATRAVRIDEELLGGPVMDGRDTVLQGTDGKWFWPGSSNFQYDTLEEYIAANQQDESQESNGQPSSGNASVQDYRGWSPSELGEAYQAAEASGDTVAMQAIARAAAEQGMDINEILEELGNLNVHRGVQLRENWVEQTGGLPSYIREIADALMTKGFDESRAIATAVNTVKRWARAGSAAKGGDGSVSVGTVAKAIAALAEWEAKKAAAHATAVQTDLLSKFGTQGSVSILEGVPGKVIEGIASGGQTVKGAASKKISVPKRAQTPQQVEESKEAAVRHNVPQGKKSTRESRAAASAKRAARTITASGGKLAETRTQRAAHGQPQAEYDRSLVASGAARTALAAPIKPPAQWFADPKFRGASPLTVTKDGQVFGHLALWGSCHTGVDGACLTVPKSYSDYSLFHLGVVECEDGTEVPVGRLAMDTGHANDTFGSRKAIAHYENTGLAIADLRAGEDQYGIWVAGALRPDATPEQVRALKASPLSGDWRHNPATNSLDLVMALAVNQPGFTVPRPKFLVASGAVRTLTAAGMLAPAKVSKIKVQRALAGDESAAADIRYLQKLANQARAAEAAQLKAKVLESTGARKRIQEMAASLSLTKEES